MSTQDDRRRFRRLEALCSELEQLPPQQRAQRLEELEASEPELFPELRQLAATYGPGSDFDLAEAGLGSVAANAATLLANHSPEGPEQHVDRYRLIRKLGSGGMGEVWEAEQSEPVQRRVAVKVLHQRFVSEGRLARFQVEQQALATMDHPNIARVFDGGETAAGQPYFVMELIEGGMPITEYCSQHELDLEQRLGVFLPVCEAVDHAHRKRVIHRDLKPSNVLITEDAGQPLVKVIDFGIAKPVDAPKDGALRDEAPLSTVAGELVGTPEYMSPEQASLGAIDVDTRSDVFTLGLLLYELIVGELPLASAQLQRLPFDEVCRRIREDETPRASSRLRQTKTGTAAGSWRRVQGDLDRIVAKALAKDRQQRYASAAELAEDLRRFLAHQPVRATPPSGIYRLRKFARRHRASVAAALFLSLGLVTGLAVAVIGFAQAKAAERDALANLADLEASESFLIALFREASPLENPGSEPTASELLQRGVERLDALDGQPRVQGRLLHNLGEVQNVRGQFDDAEALLRRAVEVLAKTEEFEQLANAKVRLASLLRRRYQLEEAESQAREALELLDQHAIRSVDVRGGALTNLASVLSRAGRFAEANAVYDELIPLARQAEDPDPRDLATIQFNAAVNLSRTGDVQGAIAAVQEPMAAFRKIWPDGHPNLGTLHMTLGAWNRRIGRAGCALQQQQQALEIYRNTLSATHSNVGDALNSLSITYLALGQPEEAASASREAIEVFLASQGEGTPSVLTARGHLASSNLYAGRYAEAAQAYLETIEGWEQLEQNPDRSRVIANNWRLLAVALRSQALIGTDISPPDAASLLEEAASALDQAERAAEASGRANERPKIALQRAILQAQLGRDDEARAFLATLQASLPDPSVLDLPQGFQFRAQASALSGNEDEAWELLRSAIEGKSRAQWLTEAPEIRALGNNPSGAGLDQQLHDLLVDPSQCQR